jgi:hypothetical protein
MDEEFFNKLIPSKEDFVKFIRKDENLQYLWGDFLTMFLVFTGRHFPEILPKFDDDCLGYLSILRYVVRHEQLIFNYDDIFQIINAGANPLCYWDTNNLSKTFPQKEDTEYYNVTRVLLGNILEYNGRPLLTPIDEPCPEDLRE